MDDEFEDIAGPVAEEPEGRGAYDTAIDGETRPDHILPEPDGEDRYKVFARSEELGEEALAGNSSGSWYPARRVFDAVVDIYQDMEAVGDAYGRTYEADGAMTLANGYNRAKVQSEVVRPEKAETLISCGYRPLQSQFTIFSEDEQVKIWIGYHPEDEGEEGAFRAGASLEDVSLDELTAVRDVLWDRIGQP